MPSVDHAALRAQLSQKKAELDERLSRITANVRRGLEADSKEQAKQLEDQEVVDALGNEAREELAKVVSALDRLDSGEFGICQSCGSDIAPARLSAYPHAAACISCASAADQSAAAL